MSVDAATKVFRARKTCFRMLYDRGYLVPQRELELTSEQFVESYGSDFGLGGQKREELTVFAEHKDDPTEKVFIFFPDEPKVGVKTIKMYVERMKQEQVYRAIVVYQVGLTPFGRQSLVESSSRYLVEHFQEAELLVNITEHVLVPEHIMLSDADKKR